MSSDNGDKKKSVNTECILNIGNFSKVKPYHLFDKAVFMKSSFQNEVSVASPKLVALMEKIIDIDSKDKEKHGKLFKHMIFTDLKSSTYGLKIIASAFIAAGFVSVIKPDTKTGLLLNNGELNNNTYGNFAMLSSKPLYDNHKMNVKFVKTLLSIYNDRDDNVHGEKIRFIILDQAFGAGIDLFDVKYCHLFDPIIIPADEKQAIGRSTRFCGQKKLEFHPLLGWPLHVSHSDQLPA